MTDVRCEPTETRVHVDGTQTSVQIVARQAEVVDAKHGVVLVPLEPGDTDTAGTYWAEFEVTFGDGRVETYPNRGYLTVNIEPDLG